MTALPDDEAARRVADTLGIPVEDLDVEPALSEAPGGEAAQGADRAARPSPKQVVRRLAKRAVGPALNRLVPRLADAVVPAVAADPRLGVNSLAADMEGRIAHLDARLAAVQADRDLPTSQSLALVESLATNQELFKAELQGLRAALEDFGLAIAPASGLPAAADRLAELRARLDVVDKRVRSLVERTEPLPDDTAVLPATFDYVGFEQRFRGDTDVVLRRVEERYFDLLEGATPVLDVGCGRGEVLAALAARGVQGVGVDLDAGMVGEARAVGVEAHHGDAIAYLHDREPEAFGAVIAIQVAEHLSLEALLTLIELAWSRLRPGGRLILETPNPASLIVLGNSYLLDPTHVRPLHPSLLAFLVERAGFADVRLEFFEPATGYHLPLLDEDEPWAQRVNAAFTRLNDVLFGPQDYAVIATK